MKKLVRIKDIPFSYVYETGLFSGELSKVANNILGIRKQIEEAYVKRQQSVPNGNFTPLERYEKISVFPYSDGDGVEFGIIVECEETDDEYQKRLDVEKNKIEALKKAKEKKIKTNEQRERTLLAKLKQKYEK